MLYIKVQRLPYFEFYKGPSHGISFRTGIYVTFVASLLLTVFDGIDTSIQRFHYAIFFGENQNKK
jgi:hypothetical protein